MVARPSLCIVKGSGPVETFVRAHADGLPANVTLIHGLQPRLRDRPVLSQSLPSRACRKALRVLQRREWEWEITSAYLKVFRRARPKAVLAEFGQSGVVVLDACRRMDLPLIVHFTARTSASIRSSGRTAKPTGCCFVKRGPSWRSRRRCSNGS
jgi:hypothetical protein